MHTDHMFRMMREGFVKLATNILIELTVNIANLKLYGKFSSHFTSSRLRGSIDFTRFRNLVEFNEV